MSYVVYLKRLSSNAKLPTKGTVGSAYYDLYAAEDSLIIGRETKAVTTGWRIEVPTSWFLDVRTRSGMALKGVAVNNAPGTVDADFRGELKVILTNHTLLPYQVNVGDRIAQCALMPVVECDFQETDTLTETVRGKNGYGSTGK